MKSTSTICKTILLSSAAWPLADSTVFPWPLAKRKPSLLLLPMLRNVIARQWIVPALTSSDAFDLSAIPRPLAAPERSASSPASDPIRCPPLRHTQRYILPDQQAPHLTSSDKVVLGFARCRHPLFPQSASLASAGWSHLTNGSPNYGVNSTAFAQRFGAAVARDTSEGLFTDCIFAPTSIIRTPATTSSASITTSSTASSTPPPAPSSRGLTPAAPRPILLCSPGTLVQPPLPMSTIPSSTAVRSRPC